ncbi:hypothetical protein BC938DRAFT_476834 [Jimgerdemannia flammicorona]|uniref:Uncharacterized protein n=1 Tax=Jimgerdemannia flammicorona TaxID=994334 RepID=A0A433QQ53_9FUNG|nr:hypothetical protein BC938DRAFT_476834 [Jimgerdemannia flammicorona]
MDVIHTYRDVAPARPHFPKRDVNQLALKKGRVIWVVYLVLHKVLVAWSCDLLIDIPTHPATATLPVSSEPVVGAKRQRDVLHDRTVNPVRFLDAFASKPDMLASVMAEDLQLFPPDIQVTVNRHWEHGKDNGDNLVDIDRLSSELGRDAARIRQLQVEIDSMKFEPDHATPEAMRATLERVRTVSADLVRGLVEFIRVYDEEIQPWVKRGKQSETVVEGLGPVASRVYSKFDKLRSLLEAFGSIRTSHEAIASLLRSRVTDNGASSSLEADSRLNFVDATNETVQEALLRVEEADRVLRDGIEWRANQAKGANVLC